MDIEAQDRLRTFCEEYISQNREKWPPSEYELAEAFVLHFGIPFTFRVADLKNFLIQTNIELIERDLPADLLGANISSGVKRQIFTSTGAEHVPFRVHTVLHEIREVMEADFRGLGFPTTNSRGLDSRADEFSFAVHMSAATPSIQGWVNDPSETTSTWQSFASLCFCTVMFALFGLHSLFGAFGYRFQRPSDTRSHLKHSKR